ncbi:MAG: S8 family serine peptidase [Chloroflexota bacterium]
MGFPTWRGAGHRLRAAGSSAILAAALVFGGLTQAVPVATADSVGELVVQPVPGKTIVDVNRKFGTSTQLQLVDTTQALVKSSAVRATLAAMQADAASSRPTVLWAEENVRADDPRAQDDSGADPFCPPPPPDVPTEASAQDDSGADQRCTRIIPVTGLLRYGNQYAVDRTDLDQAQRIERGRGQTVAVLDTQVDALHPAFLLHIKGGLDLVPNSLLTALPTQGRARGHGTFVAGIVRRAAPEAVVLPVRVLNDDGRGSTAQVAAGIRWAVKHGATVINMSLHTPTDTRVMREAVAYAQGKGVVLVAAYGNEGKNAPAAYPADYPGVISVMATDQHDARASFSNYGRAGLVAAPGVNIISAYPTAMWAIGSGTSYAAPWVAGQAALVREAKPGLNPTQVLQVIQNTSDNVSAANRGTNTVRINAYRSVR